jgi:hypothetical protein
LPDVAPLDAVQKIAVPLFFLNIPKVGKMDKNRDCGILVLLVHNSLVFIE